ncbi:hypothetical protein [Actinomyces ruminis]|uniref:hypothetical protein n=1 Tax=Actinomyces ruminis TaxID=1937003 RepID=UPI0015D501A3|nr:hypothetical protein [Actinomyces ruminis]
MARSIRLHRPLTLAATGLTAVALTISMSACSSSSDDAADQAPTSRSPQPRTPTLTPRPTPMKMPFQRASPWWRSRSTASPWPSPPTGIL